MKRMLDIEKFLDTFNLDLGDDFVKTIDTSSAITTNNRYVWFQPPEKLMKVCEILRKNFDISDKYQCMLTVIPPSEEKIKISPSKNLVERVILSTRDDNMSAMANGLEQHINIKKWESVKIPMLICKMIDIVFDPSIQIKNSSKKGHRDNCGCLSCRKVNISTVKKVKERYILLFDFINSNKNELNENTGGARDADTLPDKANPTSCE